MGSEVVSSMNPQDVDSRSQHGRSPQPGRSSHHLGPVPDSGGGGPGGLHAAPDTSRGYPPQPGPAHYARGDVSSSSSSGRPDGAVPTSSSSVPQHGYPQNYMYPNGNTQRHSSSASSPKEASPAPLLNPQYETLSDDEN